MMTLMHDLRKLAAKNDYCVKQKHNTWINYMTEIQNSVYQVKESLHGEYFPEHRHIEVTCASNSAVVFTKPCIELELFVKVHKNLQQYSMIIVQPKTCSTHLSKNKSNVKDLLQK